MANTYHTPVHLKGLVPPNTFIVSSRAGFGITFPSHEAYDFTMRLTRVWLGISKRRFAYLIGASEKTARQWTQRQRKMSPVYYLRLVYLLYLREEYHLNLANVHSVDWEQGTIKMDVTDLSELPALAEVTA